MNKLEVVLALIISEGFLGGVTYVLILMICKNNIVVDIIFTLILIGVVGFMVLLLIQAVETLNEIKGNEG